MADEKYTSRHTGQEIDDAVDAVLNGTAFEVVNNLTTNDGTKPLSAKMGKKLKENIEVLNENIEALNDALANIAFKSLPRPTMSELDFGGDKYAVTINNTLSGCTANKSGIQQVTEGNNLIITITADAGNLLRSVTSNVGDVSIAANKESATITISNVMSDLSVSIEASATTKGVFTSSISDSRVSGTGSLSDIVEGSAWSSKLSLNGTAEEGASITSISATMGGDGEISVNGDTISTDFVTGNITISVVVAIVGKKNVVYKLRNMVVSTDNAVNGMVNEGSTFEATLDNAPMNTTIGSTTLPLYGNNIVGSWSTPSVVVKKGGIDITETAYDSQTKQINISNVDGDIEVNAVCEPKVFRNSKVQNGGSSWNARYPISQTDRNVGVNSLYIHIPIGCSKIRWFHNAQKTNQYFNTYYFELFTAIKSGQTTKWAYPYVSSQISIGGSGGDKFSYNYTNASITAVENNSVYVMAYFAQGYLSSCFLVDTTNVDESELQQADQAAVDAYNAEHGTSYTTQSRIVCASLDDIVAIGGKVIFDGRYSELTDLPS